MKVFSVGEASYDITMPISSYPKEGSKTYVGKKIECAGGTASNVAVLLSDWGEKSFYVGTVGNDYYGKKINDSFFLHSVNTKYLTIVNDANTTTTSIISSCDKGSRTILSFKDDNLFSKKNNYMFNKPDVIFFDGYEEDETIRLLEKNKKSLTILGTTNNCESVLSFGPLMNYVIISDDVARKISEIKFKNNDKDSIKDAYKIIEEKINTDLIITLGEEGAFTKINSSYQIIPSMDIRVKDTVAAGDIFCGAFTYFITHNYKLKKAVELSNIAGAISATRLGGRFSIPSLEEVLSYDK